MAIPSLVRDASKLPDAVSYRASIAALSPASLTIGVGERAIDEPENLTSARAIFSGGEPFAANVAFETRTCPSIPGAPLVVE